MSTLKANSISLILLLPTFCYTLNISAQAQTAREMQDIASSNQPAPIQSRLASLSLKNSTEDRAVLWSDQNIGSSSKMTVGESEAFMRSNYTKRLADMQEQIELASASGWLTPAKAQELKDWQNEISKEEQLFRTAGGGIIRIEDVNQLERHLNGLAYVIARQLNPNTSKTASTASSD